MREKSMQRQVAQLFKDERKSRQWTPTEMANYLDISHSKYTDIEKGISNIRIGEVGSLLAQLGLSLKFKKPYNQSLFWQAVGFKKVRRKVYWYRVSGDRKTVVISPDNEIFIQSCLADGSNYPDMDANNFFKWVIPALLKKTDEIAINLLISGETDIPEMYKWAWSILVQ